MILRLRDDEGDEIVVPAIKGPPGKNGASIQTIERTDGTGNPGTTDTYTITMTDGRTFDFQVYNGADGTMTFADLTEEQKASLKGEPGYTPVKGTDYWTSADIAEIQTYIDNSVSIQIGTALEASY